MSRRELRQQAASAFLQRCNLLSRPFVLLNPDRSTFTLRSLEAR
jgi:hypothetical protein